MIGQQGLKTLADYRRAARETIFSLSLPVWEDNVNEDVSFCNSVKVALEHSRSLIVCARDKIMQESAWNAIYLPETEYELRNYPLFEAIKLMEFAIKYSRQPVIELLSGWPKRPDANARCFIAAGISYLEAAFNFVYELGGDIISCLQNGYKKYNKESNIIYYDPFHFLNKTPQVDNLQINPSPDETIKTWFDTIMNGTQRAFPGSEYSYNKIIAEFRSIHKQLDYEKALWEKTGQTNHQRDTQNYSDFLLNIAKEVNKLVEQHRDRFTAMVKEFEDRFSRWQEDFREIYQNAKDNRYLRQKANKAKSKKIPGEYIFYDLNQELYYDADDHRFDFWGPPISVNPADTLRKRHFYAMVFQSQEDTIARPPTDLHEDLLRKYYLLAVIHAFKGAELGVSVLKNVSGKYPDECSNEPAMLVWGQYEDRPRCSYPMAEKELIEAALNTVLRDIETIGTEKTINDTIEEHLPATPKTDSKLVYQADAATFYNIPKSTLSKAANKEPGEPGYLWSGHEGKRIFYRKRDCEKLSQSRMKLRNN